MSGDQLYFSSLNNSSLASNNKFIQRSSPLCTARQSRPKRQSLKDLSDLILAQNISNMSHRVQPRDLKRAIDALLARGLTHASILKHCLGQHRIPFASSSLVELLQDAVIVSLDAEWFEHDPEYVTELGVTILDPRKIKDRSQPWEILKATTNHHVRVKANAHLINGEMCAGHPEDFQFGKTSFVDMNEAKETLASSFIHIDGLGRPRPVIFLGHAVDNDTKTIEDRFGLDIDKLGVVVATVDTQSIAQETRLAATGRPIGLGSLLAKFDIVENYLHNAGNDIVCTMVAALLMLMQHHQPASAVAYAELKRHLQTHSRPVHGTLLFCTRCDSDAHVVTDCRVIVRCANCAAQASRSSLADSHKTDRCRRAVKDAVMKRAAELPKLLPVPCEHCIVSVDLARNGYQYAYRHSPAECPHGPA